MFRSILIASVLFYGGIALCGKEIPWFTGPLLTQNGQVLPEGAFEVKTTCFSVSHLGYKNNHWELHKTARVRNNVNLQIETNFGLTSLFDVALTPQFFYTSEGKRDSWQLGDLVLSLGLKIFDSPFVKLSLQEVFPTGNYQNLRLRYLSTDLSGGGSFETILSLIASNVWHHYGNHFLSLQGNLSYGLFAPVNLHGFNTYGGDPTTGGLFFPGSIVDASLGAEYSLTRNWALALDIAAVYSGRSNFQGKSIARVGNTTPVFSSSIAPAIEYNFSEDVGILGGVWFSLYKYRAFRFTNGVIALNAKL